MILLKDRKIGGYAITSLEEVLDNINAYIRYRLPEITFSEAIYLTNTLCKELDNKLNDYYNSLKETKKVALELSNYDDVFNFLTENISEDTLNRIKSINLEEHNKCSDALRSELKKACINNNPDELIGILNNKLGNCCISSIDDLDDE